MLSDFLLIVESTCRKKSSKCLISAWFSSRSWQILKQLMLSTVLFEALISSLNTIMSLCFRNDSFSPLKSGSLVSTIPKRSKGELPKALEITLLQKSFSMDLLSIICFDYLNQIEEMDVRGSGSGGSVEQAINAQEDSKINDALIYNIIKKIELKMAMEDKYEKERIPMIKKLPSNLGQYLYSPLSLGYFVTVMLGMTYLRYKAKRKITFQALVPHFVLAFTINQFERYRGIMAVDLEMTNEYKSFQHNAAEIMAEKKRRISLLDIVRSSQVVTIKKLKEMLKFRPLY